MSTGSTLQNINGLEKSITASQVSEAKCSIHELDTLLEDGKREGSNAIFSVKYYDIKPFLMGGGGACHQKTYG